MLQVVAEWRVVPFSCAAYEVVLMADAMRWERFVTSDELD